MKEMLYGALTGLVFIVALKLICTDFTPKFQCDTAELRERILKLESRATDLRERNQRLVWQVEQVAAAVMLINAKVGDPLSQPPGGETTFPEPNEPEVCE